MAIPAPINIGWKQIVRDYTVIQGNHGIITLTFSALRQDGTPYPSYTGFTGKFTLYTLGGTSVQTLVSPNVEITPSPSTHEITVVITFSSANTLLLPPDSDLIGDLMIVAPDGIEKQFPFKMKLKVFRSFTR